MTGKLPSFQFDGARTRHVIRPGVIGSGLVTVNAVIFLAGAQAMAADGLTTLPSKYGPKETMDRLEAAVTAKGLTVFARIDHAASAAAVGLPLRPTELLIFGNAKGGTPLMQSVQTIGIDLPLKALVWRDANGATWLAYNEPGWIARRHSAGHEAEPAIGGLAAALAALVKAATAASP